ncbi:YeeE/YedE family protein [soil metagenome]
MPMTFRHALIFLAGALFGVGLALSGMTDPARVVGFLDVTGDWDPALAFVMGGALGTYAAATAITRKVRGGRGWFGTRLPVRCSDPVSRRLIVGAAVFGVGWGLAGFCPGPALANLGWLRAEALVFVPAMALGMILAQRLFGADKG